jgi:hypothetical protein
MNEVVKTLVVAVAAHDASRNHAGTVLRHGRPGDPLSGCPSSQITLDNQKFFKQTAAAQA